MTMMELERQRYREGMEHGIERAKEKYYHEGMERGIKRGELKGSITTLYELGYSVPEIAKKLNQEEDTVLKTLDLQE